MLVIFFDWRGVIQKEFVPEGETINAVYYKAADYFLFPKVISYWKRCLFDSISDIQKVVTNTLNTIAKDDFYKGIQKLYDRANLCVQLEGKYVEN